MTIDKAVDGIKTGVKGMLTTLILGGLLYLTALTAKPVHAQNTQLPKKPAIIKAVPIAKPVQVQEFYIGKTISYCFSQLPMTDSGNYVQKEGDKEITYHRGGLNNESIEQILLRKPVETTRYMSNYVVSILSGIAAKYGIKEPSYSQKVASQGRDITTGEIVVENLIYKISGKSIDGKPLEKEIYASFTKGNGMGGSLHIFLIPKAWQLCLSAILPSPSDAPIKP